MSGPWRRDIQERIDRQNAMKAAAALDSGTERLREAADWYDRNCDCGLAQDDAHCEHTATAALLRAASRQSLGWYAPLGGSRCCSLAEPCAVHRAALKLADVVLGAESGDDELLRAAVSRQWAEGADDDE